MFTSMGLNANDINALQAVSRSSSPYVAPQSPSLQHQSQLQPLSPQHSLQSSLRDSYQQNPADLPQKQMSSTIQIIDENKRFNPALSRFVSTGSISKVGLDYHVISVFGSQSTGKSTLLNALFNTKFAVMDQKRRSQTTKGIWLAKINSLGQQRIMVMDVEGTDGRERGEDQDFERKAALFALATSEVLIVNVWENQVGLYQGANMGLLKTVFEVNLTLFHNDNSPKSLLLFVIRDFIGMTPLENLAANLESGLNEIWKTLNKPKGLENVQLTDFFDLQFETLPHKILQPKEFDASVDVLADRFIEVEDEGYVFQPNYHRNVPIDGWGMYAEQVWEQIELNKDLDLPTQQILVARFRCDEISNDAFSKFEVNFKNEGLDSKDSLIIQDLGDILRNLRDGALNDYDIEASRYNKSVYNDKRTELLNKIDNKLKVIYKNQLALLIKASIDLFHSHIDSVENIGVRFLDRLTKASHLASDYFISTANEASVDDEVYNCIEELQEFSKLLEDNINERRVKEINEVVVTKSIKSVRSMLKDKILGSLTNPSSATWDEVNASINTTLTRLLSKFLNDDGEYDLGVGANSVETDRAIETIQKQIWKLSYNIIRATLNEDSILSLMKDKFEDLFRYDEEGLPRIWKQNDDLDTPFCKAKDEALKVLDILSVAKLSNGNQLEPTIDIFAKDDNELNTKKAAIESDDEEEEEEKSFSHIVTDYQISKIKASFKKQSDANYIEAKRSTIQSISQIPYWIYILIVFLGWNEFMSVLRNPLYFTFLILIGAGGYITYTLHLWGPMMRIAEQSARTAIDIGKEKLADIVLELQESQRTNIAVPNAPVRTGTNGSLSSHSTANSRTNTGISSFSEFDSVSGIGAFEDDDNVVKRVNGKIRNQSNVEISDNIPLDTFEVFE